MQHELRDYQMEKGGDWGSPTWDPLSMMVGGCSATHLLPQKLRACPQTCRILGLGLGRAWRSPIPMLFTGKEATAGTGCRSLLLQHPELHPRHCGL